jgi:hypothetical protein
MFFAFHIFLATIRNLCHSCFMGNKDARNREKKKPKKQPPKLAPLPRASHQTTTATVVTRINESK